MFDQHPLRVISFVSPIHYERRGQGMKMENGWLALEDKDVKEIVQSIHHKDLTPKDALAEQIKESGFPFPKNRRILMPNERAVTWD